MQQRGRKIKEYAEEILGLHGILGVSEEEQFKKRLEDVRGLAIEMTMPPQGKRMFTK